MATTLAKIREQTLAVLGYSADDSRLPPEHLTTLINNSVNRVTTRRDWPWLVEDQEIQTVPRTSQYVVPPDWSRTLRVARGDYDMTLISPRNTQAYERRGLQATAYYVERGHLWIVPAPDEELDLVHVYYKDEPVLTGETDTLALPERFIDSVVCETLQQVATRLDDDGLFAKAFAQGQKAMERMDDEVIRTVGTGRVTSRSDWALV